MIVNEFMLKQAKINFARSGPVPRIAHPSLALAKPALAKPALAKPALAKSALVRSALVMALAVLWAGPVQAQPLQLPGAAIPAPSGSLQTPPPAAIGPAVTGPAARKAPPAVRAPTEESVIDRAYRRNGEKGEMKVQKMGSGYGLRLTAEGFQTNNLAEACAVSFGETPLPLKSLGKPLGLPRYELEAPICPIVFDVLDGALLVMSPREPCVIEAAQCRVDPRGLWGPDSRILAGQAKDIEKSRARAEAALRDGYKNLAERASLVDQRMIARERAGFSSERELICREYQREGTHGFCAAKVTEARAAELRARTGGAGQAGEKPVRRKKPKPTAAVPAPALN